MPRIETRVTSVQVVSGFEASLVIPNPPGWYSSTIPSPHPTGDARANADEYPIKKDGGSSHSLKLEEESVILSINDVATSGEMKSESESSTVSTISSSFPGSVDERGGHQGSFQCVKIHNEETFVNYVVNNGDWLDGPPRTLDFTSCKKGPTIYVNDVSGKNVTQLWWWESDKWVSVKEGDVFFTERDRTLELDRNRIPRLRALRRRGRS